MPSKLNTRNEERKPWRGIRGTTFPLCFFLLVLFSLSFNAGVAQPQTPQEASPTPNAKRILVLCSYGYSLPAYQKLNSAFLTVLQNAGLSTNGLFFEYLDLLHIKDKEHRQALADMLRHKYAELNIDLIVTLHSPALSFLLDEAKDIFPNVPITCWMSQETFDTKGMGPRIFRVHADYGVQDTLKRALELFPRTKRVIFISGVMESDRQFEQEAKSSFANWENKLQIEYTSNLSVEEMLDRVANLSPQSIVIYWNVFRDKTGRTFTPRDIGEMVAKTANAPVFCLYDTLLGHGVIGGSLLSFEAEGARVGNLALDILNGKVSLSEQASTVVDSPVPMFDWQQIEKWGGNVSKLPEASVFINRTPSLWNQYGKYLIALVFFSIVQSFFIVSLLVQKRRRRAAEVSLERHLNHLEELVKERTEDLANQREWLQVTLTSIGDAVIATDVEGFITFINPVAAELTGWQEDEARGQMVEEVFLNINEQTREPAEDIIRRVLREGNLAALENHTALVTRDGREIPIEESAAPIRDGAGSLIGVVLVFHDVTEKRRAQEALRESEERLRLFIGNAPVSLAMFDRSMRYLSASRRWLTDHNLEQTDLTGLSHYEVFPEIPEYWKEVHRRGLAGEVVRADADRFERANGFVQWLRWEVRPWHDAAGDVGGIVIFSEDITERKLAEEQLLRAKNEWERTFDSVPDLIAILDTRHRIVRANLEMAQRLGVTPEQCVGLCCYESVHGSDLPPEFCPHTLTLNDGKEHVAEVHEEGLGGDFLLSTTPLRDDQGVLIGAVHVARDITERKRIEKELRRSRDELDLRVRERTAELSVSNKALMEYAAKLERLNEELQDFAFVATHDLQEPLRKIQTFCDLVEKRCAPALDSAGQEYLDRVISSASRMRQLLRDLLEFSRVTTGPEPFQEVDFSRILREATDVFEDTIKETGGLIQIETMPTIDADAAQILRLFKNLIDNALKFRSAEPPRIVVYAKQDGQRVYEIFVKDNGIGFAPQFAERIFKPFQRVHKRSEYEGAGIGLTICRKIVERHGGSIRAESEPGMGATFIIRLPAKQTRLEGI